MQYSRGEGSGPEYSVAFIQNHGGRSRRGRSQVQVRVGSYANGEARLLTYHWSACKPAHMREGALPGQRPRLGRPSKPEAFLQSTVPEPTATRPVASPSQNKLMGDAQIQTNSLPSPEGVPEVTTNQPAKIQTSNSDRPVRSSRNPNPRYV